MRWWDNTTDCRCGSPEYDAVFCVHLLKEEAPTVQQRVEVLGTNEVRSERAADGIRLRRAFYVLTEHARTGRQRPTLEAAVIGLIAAITEPDLPVVRPPTSRRCN